MNYYKLILSGLKYYFKSHFWVAIGIMISTAVLTGALIVGDSMIYSLQQSARYRLGDVTYSFSGGDRFFQYDLAQRLAQSDQITSASVLKLEGIATIQGGKHRLNNIKVWGIDNNYSKVVGTTTIYDSLRGTEVVISSNMAFRLSLKEGDRFLLRIGKVGVIPSNAPFVSGDEKTVSVQAKVKAIANQQEMGRFNLRASQTAPFNVFISHHYVADLLDLKDKANLLLASTSESNEKILRHSIQNVWNINDAGINVAYADKANQWSITSDRVFIDDYITNHLALAVDSLQPRLTYLINRIVSEGKRVPYSFVSGIHASLDEDEVIVNEWLAKDMKLKIGDSLTMTYFSIGSLRSLVEKRSSFIIKRVVPISGVYADPMLMPVLPGLSDAGNCRDWETAVPIDLDVIRDKDEAYWNTYKGLSKAFISQKKAEQLWSNRFGNATVLRMDTGLITKEELTEVISKELSPQFLGFQLMPVLEQGLFAANNGTDFGQLFIGLSFFIIVSGLLLSTMLFFLGIEHRWEQIGTLRALGFSKSVIFKLFFSETVLVAFIGALLGVLLAIGYNKLVFIALNRLWFDIVRTNVLEVSVQSNTILLGLGLSLFISLLTIYLSLKRRMKASIVKYQKHLPQKISNTTKLISIAVAGLLMLFPLSFVVYAFVKGGQFQPSVFFLSGGLLLLASLIYMYSRFLMDAQKTSSSLTWKLLARKNRTENRPRSLMQIALLAIGIYLVVSTGANRKDLFQNSQSKEGGTGGFAFVAESTVPLLINMNDSIWRNNESIYSDYSSVSFYVAEGDDASCLNLNRISNPRILGVKSDQLKGRFTFQTKSKDLDVKNPWETLNADLGDVIPAIADQTVIQWGLGKAVGDTLAYTNARGEKMLLKLVGGLAGSVFQGNVIISESAFLKNFPSTSGVKFFLIDTQNTNEVENELGSVFRDYGWEIQKGAERLAEFKSVENTYLSIFLVLGGLGLVIGTFGYGILLKRSLLSRKQEIAILLAQGLSKRLLGKILRREILGIFFAGWLIGTLTAVFSVWPLLYNNAVSTLITIVMIVFFIAITGYTTIYLTVYKVILDIELNKDLRNN